MSNTDQKNIKQISDTWEESYNGHAIELKKKRLKDKLDSPELLEIQNAYKEASDIYEKDNDEWWKKLSEEEREKAFYAVCKRIYKADIEKQTSYRYALYQVFEFDPSMYSVGMDCGYIDIHNNIYGGVELNKMSDAKKITIKNSNTTQDIDLNNSQKIFLRLKEDENILEIEIKTLPTIYDNTV